MKKIAGDEGGTVTLFGLRIDREALKEWEKGLLRRHFVTGHSKF